MFVLFLQHIVIYMRAEAVFLFLPLMFFISTVECVCARDTRDVLYPGLE